METPPEPTLPTTTTPSDETVMLSQFTLSTVEGKHADTMIIPEGMRPLPEIVLPENIRQEREEGINRLLDHPPNVDCILVLARSGTLAASGLYGNNSLIESSGLLPLPPMEAVDGIGYEVFNELYSERYREGTEDDLDCGVGDEGTDEARSQLTAWVQSTQSPQVRETIAHLRKLPRSVAILDDVKHLSTVTRGVAPALLNAAHGAGNYQYDLSNNRFIFSSLDWLDQIIRATFHDEVVDLDKRQMKFLAEMMKGKLDEHWFAHKSDPHSAESVVLVAKYYATKYESGSGGVNLNSATIDILTQRYGTNLLDLHQQLVVALKAHTEEILQKRVVSGDVQSVAAH